MSKLIRRSFLQGWHQMTRHRKKTLSGPSHSFSTSSLLMVEESEKQYTVTTEEDGIRTVCLNDPKKRNALSLAMLKQLQTDLFTIPDSLRVIILKANGPVFSAGHDLKELTSKEGREYHEKVFNMCSSVMANIQDIPVPVIAQVSGLATAAGCQLVASCDMAIASEKAGFATPGVSVGLFCSAPAVAVGRSVPRKVAMEMVSVGLFCSTPAVAVGRSVPRKVAMEMLFTGHPISAQDALLHGLVSKVVPEEKLEDETMKIARRICETSRSVVALGKATFYAQMKLEKREAYTLAGKVMVDNLALGDGQEGIKAFIEKRKPVWSHDKTTVH